MIKFNVSKLNLKSGERFYKNLTSWQKILIVLIIIMICTYFLTPKNTIIEPFSETADYKIYNNEEIYDTFYSTIYDDLVKSDIKNLFEMELIKKKTTYGQKSIILDVGSGTGHHVKLLTDAKATAIGVDKSPNMIKEANKRYPKLDFREGDIMNSMMFQDSVFTHITCLYFTIYYFKNKNLFLQNCFKWLVPNGYLVLHLVDKFKFDPIVSSGDPFTMVNPQNYADKRITNAVVKFDKFKYTSDFKLKENDITEFEEKFVFTGGKARVNKHTLYMPKQTQIISMAKNIGFILHAKIDMKECGWDDQYIYILQKPN
jgi:SAM-dependent methyltransferase